jgi:ribonuclease-3
MTSSNQDTFEPYSAENLSTLEDKLGISIKNKELLKTAISTRAARNEHPDIIKEDNERLEFLGDSVLKFLISEHLFKSKSNPEGKMTIMRMEIESNETLGAIARELDLKPHLYLSEGEKMSSGKSECTLLANSLEAVIGAIYLDEESLESTRRFVERKVLNELLQILLTQDVRDPITPLQEISQKRYGKLPEYVYTKISGESHDPVFKAEVYVNEVKMAEAEERSKKDAKKKAAKKALFILTN